MEDELQMELLEEIEESMGSRKVFMEGMQQFQMHYMGCEMEPPKAVILGLRVITGLGGEEQMRLEKDLIR